jgi:hypothetical protein
MSEAKSGIIIVSSSAKADDPVIAALEVFAGCSAFAEHDKF